MRNIPQISVVPPRLEHLVLGHGFADGDRPGAGPARLVWLCLWTHRRVRLEVYPGDPRLADQAGVAKRQVQAGLRFLERRELLERRKGRRGRSREPKRVIRLRPRVEPLWDGPFYLPKPLPQLRAVCARGRSRPHVDVAVMLGLYLTALECRGLRSSVDGYSDPFKITQACLAELLGLGRNTPRRSLDRLRALDLVRPTYADDDWSSGLRVAEPARWLALALGSPTTRGEP